jgi:hypothetical protein
MLNEHRKVVAAEVEVDMGRLVILAEVEDTLEVHQCISEADILTGDTVEVGMVVPGVTEVPGLGEGGMGEESTSPCLRLGGGCLTKQLELDFQENNIQLKS